mgnify:FL=1
MINLHPSKNQCQTPQSDLNSWWVRRTVPIDSGLERKSYFSSSASADASADVSSDADADVSALSYFGSEIEFLCFGALHQ